MSIPVFIIPYINIIIIVFLLFFVIMGFNKGLLYQTFSLLATATSIFLSWFFAPVMASTFEVYPALWCPFANTPVADIFYVKMNTLSWHVILFIGCSLAFMLLKPLAKAITYMPIVNSVNRILGVVVGLIPGLLILVLTAYFLATPLVANGKDVIDKTFFKQISSISTNVVGLLDEPFKVEKALQKLTNDPLSLTTDDVQLLWEWLISEKVDTETANEFLSEHSGNNQEEVTPPQNPSENSE